MSNQEEQVRELDDEHYRLSTGEWLPSAIAVQFGEAAAKPELATKCSMECIRLAEQYANEKIEQELERAWGYTSGVSADHIALRLVELGELKGVSNE